MFGRDAYQTLEGKASALTQSIARNWWTATAGSRWGGLIACLCVNARRLTLTNDQAFGLIIAISAGELSDAPDIADTSVRPRTAGVKGTLTLPLEERRA